MIDFSKIVKSSIESGVQSVLDGAKENSEKDEEKSLVNGYKALMRYSESLLRSYHEELKTELAKQGINI